MTLNNIKLQGVRILLIGIGLAAVFAGYSRIVQLSKKKTTIEVDRQRIDANIRQDRSVLNASKADDSAVFGALVRLSAHRDPLARSEAIRRSQSNSATVRRGAALAIGNYDDSEVYQLFEKFLSDPELAVRIDTLKSLRFRAGDEGTKRAQILFEYLKKNEISSSEKLTAYSSLYQVSTKTEDKVSALKNILNILDKEDDWVGISSQALVEAISLAPTDSLVLQKLYNVLKKNKNAQITALGIRHLSALGDNWIKNQLEFFSKSNDLQIKNAAVQSIRFACPKNRWFLLNSFFRNETNSNLLLSALKEVEAMPSRDAANLLESLIKNQILKGLAAQEAHRVFAQVGQSQQPDPCAGR